jgi:DNA-directed RNA polymerase specialized sigma24 family protein
VAVETKRGAAGRRHESNERTALAFVVGSGPGLSAERVGELLGRWQRAELRIARGFGECRGLATPELEDIYQDTVVVLLKRRYANELHLRNALREELKYGSLHFHEREGRRAEIRSETMPSIHALELESQDETERAALIRQDRLVVIEFFAELTPLEQSVFWLLAEGMKYRQIAKVLNLEGKDARKAERSCEKKRERFQILYEAGRLCGYRAATIQALQAGRATSEELAGRAFAHLESCSSCRAEHRTNARRLRLRFQCTHCA